MNEHKPDEKHHESPMTALWVSMTGASAGDHHESPPGMDTKSTKVGHEPDKFDVRSIIYVPIAVILTLIVTYALVQTVITYLIGASTDSIVTRTPMNERFERISSTEAKTSVNEKNPTRTLDGVTQPRLEWFRLSDNVRPGETEPDPEYMRSFRPLPKGNSPEIYPEDLRAENYVDPATHMKPLVETKWLKPGEKAQIPIADAMALLLEKNKLPTKKETLAPKVPQNAAQVKPKLSNGGATFTPPKDKEAQH